jgi:hypothetical protein
MAALMLPKKTMLSAGVKLKFVPIIVTRVSTGPDAGKRELIIGCADTIPTIKKDVNNVTHFFLILIFLKYIYL